MKMQRTEHQTPVTAGRLTLLSMALMAALAAMEPTVATAQTVVSGVDTTPQSWNRSDFTVEVTGRILIPGTTGTVVAATSSVGTLSNSGEISGGASGVVFKAGSMDMLINNAGGTIQSASTGISNLGLSSNGAILPGNINMLSNSGTISGGNTGIANHGTIGNLSNSGTISAVFLAAINNTGAITALTNDSAGTISGEFGIYNSDATTNATVPLGNIGSLNNAGTISGRFDGIANLTTIGTLVNSGAIESSGASGIDNSGTINTLINSGAITGTIATGINNTGAITALTNNSGGTISGSTGIINHGTINTLINSGAITGSSIGISNGPGVIDTLTNHGEISGGVTAIKVVSGSSIGALSNTATITSNASSTSSGLGIFNLGTISSLDNSGSITAGGTAISNSGVISMLTNSGTISANGNAIGNTAGGTLETIVNSGTIIGAVRNLSAKDLTLIGGTGAIFGTFTGVAGAIGTIANQNSNLIFASGNVLLNDHVNLGSNTMFNTGAVLQVNDAISITGNYRQNINASLNIGVGDSAVANGAIATDSGYGRLVVSGSATIDSGSTVVLKKLNTYNFAQGQRFVVVQAAAGGTNYNAGSLVYTAPGFNVSGATVADGGNADLLLTLSAIGSSSGSTGPADSSDSSGSPGSSRPINRATDGNARASLAGLFAYTGTDDALMNLFNAAAAIGSSAEGNRAGVQLSPAASASGVAGASTALTQQLNNLVFNRLNNPSSPSPSSPSLSLSGASGVSSGEASSGTAVWSQAFGGRASDGGRDEVAGYHASYSGLLIGTDTALNDRWRVGGLADYAATSVSSDGNNAGSSAHVNSYGLTAYAGYTGNTGDTGQPWYLNMSAGVTRNSITAHRLIDFTGFNGTANSSYNGSQYIVAAQAGYPIAMGNTVLTPLAGLTYGSLRQDGYTETGGNGAALHVDGSDTHSIKSDLGLKLEHAYQTPYGALKPVAQLLWRHEYSDTRLQSVANFAADTSGATTFTSQGASPVGDTGVLSLGVTLLHNEHLSVSANYTLESGGGYTAQTGDLLVRWLF
jgi:outer membrane autotransporter protein